MQGASKLQVPTMRCRGRVRQPRWGIGRRTQETMLHTIPIPVLGRLVTQHASTEYEHETILTTGSRFLVSPTHCPTIRDWARFLAETRVEWFEALETSPRTLPVACWPISIEQQEHVARCPRCQTVVGTMLQTMAHLYWSSCPTAQELVGWMHGERLPHVAGHLETCALCRKVAETMMDPSECMDGGGKPGRSVFGLIVTWQY